jgi:hypothetical protein
MTGYSDSSRKVGLSEITVARPDFLDEASQNTVFRTRRPEVEIAAGNVRMADNPSGTPQGSLLRAK